MPKIEFTIKGGKVSIDAIGFTGTACEAATKRAEELLGGEIHREHKPEYYEQEIVQEQKQTY